MKETLGDLRDQVAALCFSKHKCARSQRRGPAFPPLNTLLSSYTAADPKCVRSLEMTVYTDEAKTLAVWVELHRHSCNQVARPTLVCSGRMLNSVLACIMAILAIK